MKLRGTLLVAAAIVLVGAMACRENVPDGDPKTPANSPLPKITPKDSDPKTSPVGDAG